MDKIKEKAAEVLQAHAYSGGYDVDDIYGKSSEPAKSSHASGHDESPYTSVYNKPSKHSSEDLSASHGYGRKPASEEESYQSHGYGQKPEESSEDGYGRKPIRHGSHDDESEVKPSFGRKPGQYGDDQEGYSRPAHASKPAYEEESYSEGGYSRPGHGLTSHGYQGEDEPPKTHSHSRPEFGGRPSYGHEEFSSRPGYGKYGDPEEFSSEPGYGKHGDPEEFSSRPGYGKHGDPEEYSSRPGYGKHGDPEEYSSRPGYVKHGDPEEFSARPGYGKHGDPEEFSSRPGYGKYGDPEENERHRPSRHNDYGHEGSGLAGGVGFGDEYERPRPGHKKHENEQSGFEEGRPAWQQDIGDSGYGGRRPHGRQDDEYETGRTEGWTSGYGKHGNPLEEGEERRQTYYGGEGNDSGDRTSGRGRHGRGDDESDYLAEQTEGLSLGGDSYSKYEKPKRHDDDEEEDRYKKHGHKHHHKHDDDSD